MQHGHISKSTEKSYNPQNCIFRKKKIGIKKASYEWQLALLTVKGKRYSLVSMQDGHQLWVRVQIRAETK